MGYTAGSCRLALQGSIDGITPQLWFLTGTDSNGTVEAAGYISDAQALGMKVNDVVWYVKSDTHAFAILIVTAVASTGSTLGASPATGS